MRVNPMAVRSSKETESGFSMIELMVVVAIILIITAIAIPNIGRVLDDAKLRASAQELTGLYQEARMRAARDNTYYEVMATPTGQAPEVVWIDLNGDGQRQNDEPAVELPSYMTLSDAGVPANLTSTMLGFQPITTTTSVTYNQSDSSTSGIAWNARGLPCQRPAVASTCGTMITVAGSQTAVGWLQYLQLQSSRATQYAAVSVTPAGRIKVWLYDASGAGSWK
jgi:prepilin-type N-terminal cleavage/methylation domain-containing protein